jgi:hypothetical protein
MRWTSAGELTAAEPDRAFDLRREITVIFELDSTPEFGHVSYTRGLAKFGRPDLVVTHLDRKQTDAAHTLLMSIGQALAMGDRLEENQTLSISDSPRLRIRPYLPDENAPELNLNNEGRIISDAGPGTEEAITGIDAFAAYLEKGD